MDQTNVDYVRKIIIILILWDYLDEHKLSIQEVANRYGTSVDINNVLNSQV